MKINNKSAEALLRAEASRGDDDEIDQVWAIKVEKLSRLCEDGISKTHIAFLGTVILAKAIDRDADLFAIKPTHAADNPRAFSARALCHSVLVPLSAELGFSIGVTGREPLNNQPYFRMTHLGDDTPVHPGGRAAFAYMIELVHELQALPDEAEARRALSAFIAVRRRYFPRYEAQKGTLSVTPEQLVSLIQTFVRQDSEGGKRAQAVVAGLMDIVAGAHRVESGRINDPSRRYPGDVCVRSADLAASWEKAIEVRDKPVRASDVQIFARKCLEMGVLEAAVVMVSETQPDLGKPELSAWAEEFGLGLTLFHGWRSFIEQALFWAPDPKPAAAATAAQTIYVRLRDVEASPQGLALWNQLVHV